jgi:cyclic pyranopterin phosphate synthase
MTPSEISRITGVSAKLGGTKVKITGGEPLLRNDLPEILGGICRVPEVEEISIVTNATLLGQDLARQLKSNGLKRININIPSVDPKTYERLTGGTLSEALAGVQAAKTAGLHPIKLNMLVLASENDSQVASMIEFARENQAILQIIELEPLQITSNYYRRYHFGLETIEKMIAEKASQVRIREHMQGRRIYSLPGVDVEFVRPVENTEFCLHCTRMRLTSDGNVKPCLMRNDDLTDLLTPLQLGATDSELERLLANTVKERRPFYAESSEPS